VFRRGVLLSLSATVLQDFNGGASVIALFVNQHQFFIERSQLVTANPSLMSRRTSQ
jgi:hypothetical protein